MDRKKAIADIATEVDTMWAKPAGTTLRVLFYWWTALGPDMDTLRVAEVLLDDAREWAPKAAA